MEPRFCEGHLREGLRSDHDFLLVKSGLEHGVGQDHRHIDPDLTIVPGPGGPQTSQLSGRRGLATPERRIQLAIRLD